MRPLPAREAAAALAASWRGRRPGGAGEHLRGLLADWREASARLINHYGLVLGNPEHRAQLRAAMREFLELEDDQDEG